MKTNVQLHVLHSSDPDTESSSAAADVRRWILPLEWNWRAQLHWTGNPVMSSTGGPNDCTWTLLGRLSSK